MYEHRRQPLLSRRKFQRRGFLPVFPPPGIIAGALGIGILGYHWCEGLGWLDSFLNASKILSGMGPASELRHDSGKWFAGFYALFSGVAFITIMGVIFAPIVHRFLHKFH